jgi:hypothetical protein
MWTLGVTAAGLGLVVGLYLYLFILFGRDPTSSPGIGLAMIGPYVLCGLVVLVANGDRASRVLAVTLVSTGLGLDVLIAAEFTETVWRTGGPPNMPASAFVGALILLGQYAVCVLGLFLAWLYPTESTRDALPPPSQEEGDYADGLYPAHCKSPPPPTE